MSIPRCIKICHQIIRESKQCKAETIKKLLVRQNLDKEFKTKYTIISDMLVQNNHLYLSNCNSEIIVHIYQIPECTYIYDTFVNIKNEIEFVESYKNLHLFYFENGDIRCWRLENNSLEICWQFKRLYCTKECIVFDTKYLCCSYHSEKICILNLESKYISKTISLDIIGDVTCLKYKYPLLIAGCKKGAVKSIDFNDEFIAIMGCSLNTLVPFFQNEIIFGSNKNHFLKLTI
ncbi:hypothetical protein HZS_5799 [Henneguya salminicola]|nr:hypothetical protein HZS_5799 [Henneguya salminicola]